MYINIIDGDDYFFTYTVKEYEIITKYYTPTISSKLINVTIECCFEEDKPLIEYINQYTEACTGRSQLTHATMHQHIVVFCDTDVLCDFDKCCFLYIDVKDNAVFCRSVDAYNCFGNNYKALMRGGAIHKYIDNVNIWFPKLYHNGEWNNDITFDENTIYESNVDFIKNAKAVKDWLATDRYIRYVFAQSKDNLGRTLYRFLGEYTLNREKTIKEQKAVWERTNTRVKTFKYKGSDNL